MCRGCGGEPLVRADGPAISEGVCVLRARPWTLGAALPPRVSLAWSEQRLGFRGAVHDGPVHAMGLPLDLDLHPGLFAAQGTPVLLASAALARALADAEAGGLEREAGARAGDRRSPSLAPRGRVSTGVTPGAHLGVIDRAQPGPPCAQPTVSAPLFSPGTPGAPDFRHLAVHA